jgi:heme ABC exporter ATP-binding subunit CcmA
MAPATTRTEVLDARGICKYYGDVTALRDVTLRVASGDAVLLYGSNGAGKTTLLRILATLAKPNEGHILLNGIELGRNPAAYKRRIGFVSHATFLYDDLTVLENLQLAGQLFGIDRMEDRIRAALEIFALKDRAGHLVRTLSRGLQQRVSLCRAVLHDPDFVLLDEPFTGLDAASTAELAGLMRRLPDEGKALIFSNHNFEQGVSIASRVVALEKGIVRYDGPVAGMAGVPVSVRPCTNAEG